MKIKQRFGFGTLGFAFVLGLTIGIDLILTAMGINLGMFSLTAFTATTPELILGASVAAVSLIGASFAFSFAIKPTLFSGLTGWLFGAKQNRVNQQQASLTHRSLSRKAVSPPVQQKRENVVNEEHSVGKKEEEQIQQFVDSENNLLSKHSHEEQQLEQGEFENKEPVAFQPATIFPKLSQHARRISLGDHRKHKEEVNLQLSPVEPKKLVEKEPEVELPKEEHVTEPQAEQPVAIRQKQSKPLQPFLLTHPVINAILQPLPKFIRRGISHLLTGIQLNDVVLPTAPQPPKAISTTTPKPLAITQLLPQVQHPTNITLTPQQPPVTLPRSLPDHKLSSNISSPLVTAAPTTATAQKQPRKIPSAASLQLPAAKQRYPFLHQQATQLFRFPYKKEVAEMLPISKISKKTEGLTNSPNLSHAILGKSIGNEKNALPSTPSRFLSKNTTLAPLNKEIEENSSILFNEILKTPNKSMNNTSIYSEEESSFQNYIISTPPQGAHTSLVITDNRVLPLNLSHALEKFSAEDSFLEDSFLLLQNLPTTPTSPPLNADSSYVIISTPTDAPNLSHALEKFSEEDSSLLLQNLPTTPTSTPLNADSSFVLGNHIISTPISHAHATILELPFSPIQQELSPAQDSIQADKENSYRRSNFSETTENYLGSSNKSFFHFNNERSKTSDTITAKRKFSCRKNLAASFSGK
jgi:hypothetical protein